MKLKFRLLVLHEPFDIHSDEGPALEMSASSSRHSEISSTCLMPMFAVKLGVSFALRTTSLLKFKIIVSFCSELQKWVANL